METLIHTGRTGFVMLSRVSGIGPEHIDATAVFGGFHAEVHTAIETLAQAGALHVRYLEDFKRHAFLLTIDRFHGKIPAKADGERLVHGRLISRSRQAFAYDLNLSSNGVIEARGRFLFAVQDYGGRFDRHRLETHYRNLFSCLKNDI